MQPTNDERLWQQAKKRAAFRKSLYSYLVVCAFLWGVWWFSGGHDYGNHRYPWPVWVMLGWGIALGFQYFNAYSGSKEDMAIQEYEKMKKERGE